MRTNLGLEAELTALNPEQFFQNPIPESIDQEKIYPHKKTMIQTAREGMRKTIQYLLIVAAAETPFIVNEEVEQPIPLPQYHNQSYIHFASNVVRPLPSPDAPIQEIIDSLNTDDRYQKFIKKHGSRYFPITPWTFLGNYGYSPESFQENNWKAPCNGYAEFACEVGARHGKKMYLLGLWPDGTKDRETNESFEDHKHRTSWHLVAFYKTYDENTGQYQFIIFNGDIVKLKPGEPLSTFTHEEHYEIIEPVGGIVEWKRVSDDWRAKIARHAVSTVKEHDIKSTVIPMRSRFIAQR
jgi:hypothetical protein